jgi:hypothetical protein
LTWPARRAAQARLVHIAPRERGELAEPHPGRIENEQRQAIAGRQERVHGQHVLARRRGELGALFARQAHVHAVAGRVWRNAGMVEHLCERRDALTNRLARVPLRVQGADDPGDVGGHELVHAPAPEKR